jgi:hypothetical protein
MNKKPLLCAVLMASITAPLLLSTTAYANRCDAQFKTELDKLDIPTTRIKKKFTVNIYAGGGENGGSRLERVEGWVSFNDCKGNLVMDFDAFCRPEGSYTTYQCAVPGVKNY